jgi:hypothetical protein
MPGQTHLFCPQIIAASQSATNAIIFSDFKNDLLKIQFILLELKEELNQMKADPNMCPHSY